MEKPHSGSMFYGAKASVFRKAQNLRENQTEAEEFLWNHLCYNKLGIKFRRQHPLNRFIVDFYSHELKFVIEVDGGIHSTREAKDYDSMRTALINEFGIEVIRFTNDDILSGINEAVEKISNYIKNRRLQLEELGQKS